jgi:hypothetical protein
MDQGTAAILGAFIGASAAMGSNLLVEAYKRHRDRQGAAAALAASIQATIDLARRRGYVGLFNHYVAELRAGRDVKIPTLVKALGQIDPITDRYIDRLGMFGGALSFEIAYFFSVVIGIRLDLERMGAGEFDGNLGGKVHVLTEDLQLWQDAERRGIEAARQLRLDASRWFGCFDMLRRSIEAINRANS